MTKWNTRKNCGFEKQISMPLRLRQLKVQGRGASEQRLLRDLQLFTNNYEHRASGMSMRKIQCVSLLFMALTCKFCTLGP